MMTRHQHCRNGIPVVHLDTIRTDINPALIRVTHHTGAAGTDIATAIQFIPFRGRKLEEVNLITTYDILFDGTRFHLNWR
ncbi:hypothetical protein ES703_116298 [subsurface metagenome]